MCEHENNSPEGFPIMFVRLQHTCRGNEQLCTNERQGKQIREWGLSFFLFVRCATYFVNDQACTVWI